VSSVPAGFRIRPVVFAVSVLCAAISGSAAWASALKDVRVGPNPDYTRVVIETDAKASYSLNQGEGVITVEVQASSTPKSVAAKSQQLSWVRVEPAGASSIVKIELKGPARVKQMVLTGPHRIVLDVYGDASGVAEKPTPLPKREPSVAATPKPVAPTPMVEATPQASPPLAAEDALLHEEANSLLGPEPTVTPSDQIAAAEGAGETGDESEAEEAAPTPAVAQTEPPKLPPIRLAAKKERGLVDWLMTPWVLGLLAVVALGLAVILMRRRPAKPAVATPVEESASVASLFSPEASAADQSAATESSDDTFAVRGGEKAQLAPPSGDEGVSAFDFESPEATDGEKPEAAPAQGAMVSTIGAVTSTAAYQSSPTATGGLNLAELDRRLALLEQRLEEVIDAKDRLERQVSAQTEELRVQRAAIARTQRVLRTVVRPEDDQPSEPVLKS
jgi:hypothetical protein